MISGLSTYVQFLSAIYLTICLDNMIGRRFWSPNYYALVTDELSIFKHSISSPKQAQLEAQIKDKAEQLDSKSRKRGCLMLFYCILLMFYNSFEQDYYTTLPTETDLLSYYFPFGLLLLISLILPFLYGRIFKRWLYLLLTILVLISIFVCCLITKNCYQLPDNFDFLKYTKWTIAIVLPLPIVYQLYVNWLYSTAYLCHLKWEIRDEYEKYQQSKAAYKQKKKEMADESYYQAFMNLLDSNNPDNILTELNKTLYEHLEKRCTPPSAYKLFKSWKNKSDKPLPDIPQIEDQEENLPVDKELGKTFDRTNYQKYFEEYDSFATKPKLSEFCIRHGLNYNDFHMFYKNKKK